MNEQGEGRSSSLVTIRKDWLIALALGAVLVIGGLAIALGIMTQNYVDANQRADDWQRAFVCTSGSLVEIINIGNPAVTEDMYKDLGRLYERFDCPRE